MPISLNQIANNEASLTFPYAGDTLTIVYYPSRLSDKMLRAISNKSNNDLDSTLAALGSMNAMLATLIKSWDFFQDDAQTIMWPLDEESLSELPLTFKQEIFLKIAEDMNPNSKAV
jgi:hypothetical protein